MIVKKKRHKHKKKKVSTTIFVEYVREHPEKFHFIEDFYENVKNGDLKAFSWIDPRYADAIGFPATDQHPV